MEGGGADLGRGRGGNVRGGRRRAESVALISWQFGTGPDSPGKATDVSEPVRHARRKGSSRHTHNSSHMHVHTQHMWRQHNTHTDTGYTGKCAHK